MAWFSQHSLVLQWRFAQALLAIPVTLAAIWLLAVLLRFIVDWSGATTLLVWAITHPFAFLPSVLCLVGILWIDRHLRSRPGLPVA